MVNSANAHFFQPLQPDFQSHLNIPIKFFSEQIKGKHGGKNVYLRVDVLKRTWEVKMESKRFTKGWKEFVEVLDLRVGDILIFRHEGDMLFHVTALSPSFCEIRYEPFGRQEEDEETNDDISSESEKEVEENVEPKTDQSSPCFSLCVTASNLQRDSVRVPIDFAKQNDLLEKERVEIVLKNEEGKSWTSELNCWKSCRVSIVHGWTTFCNANKLVVGDSCTFRLFQNMETLVFRLCSRAKEEKKKKKIWSAEEYIHDQTGADRFVKLTPTVCSLELSKQHLPVSFTRPNGLVNPGEIILVDKNRVEWSMKLRVDYRYGAMYMIGNDWKSFCAANEVVAGESLTLELIRGGTSPVLKFCSKMEQPPHEAQAHVHKRARIEKQKLEIREETFTKGEPSRCTQTCNKSSANEGNLQKKRPSFVSNQMAKVKQSVVDTLSSIRQFQEDLVTMEQKFEDSLQEFNNLERGEDNDHGNETTS